MQLKSEVRDPGEILSLSGEMGHGLTLALEGSESVGQAVPARLSWAGYPSGMRLFFAVRRSWQEEEGRGRPFLLFPLFLGAGATSWFAFDRMLSVPAEIAVFLLAVLCALSFYNRLPVRRVMALIGAFTAGMLLAELETWRHSTVILDSPVTASIEGRIIDLEPSRGGRWRYTLAVIKITEPALRRPPTRVRLTGLAAASALSPGDVIKGRARLAPPSGPALPGGHDFAFGNYYSDIGAVGYFYGYPQLGVAAKDAAEDKISTILAGWQSAFSLWLTERMGRVLSGDTLAFASAIMVNDRRAFSKSAIGDLRDSGLAHIIAISGLHMALTGGLVFWTLRAVASLFPGFSQRFAIKKFAAVGALAAASFYLFISGAPISALRAFLMLAIMLLAIMAGRSALNMRNLAFAALAIIIVTPSAVVSPGFLMSFAATAALIAAYNSMKPASSYAFARPGRSWMRRIASGVSRLVGGIALTSFIGGGSTALFAASTFNSLPAWGLLGNVLAMPVFSFMVMPVALLSMVAAPFGLDRPFLHLMAFGLDICLAVAHWTAGLKGAFLTGQPAMWIVIPGAAALFLCCVFRSAIFRAPLLAAYVTSVVLVIAGVGKETLPDALIFEDGKLLALVTDDGLMTNQRRPSSFVTDQWQKALAIRSLIKPGSLSEADGLASTTHISERLEPGRFFCLEKRWCAAKLANGFVIMNIMSKEDLGYACDHADLVVSPWRHVFTQCRSGARLIDARTLRRNGSVALKFERAPLGGEKDTPLFETSIGEKIRPWSRHRLFDWRTETFDAPDRYVLSDNGG